MPIRRHAADFIRKGGSEPGIKGASDPGIEYGPPEHGCVREDRRQRQCGAQAQLSSTVVSRHVHALESWLSVRLLNCSTQRVSLAEAGEASYERCVRILADVHDATGLIGELHVDRCVSVRSGSSVSCRSRPRS